MQPRPRCDRLQHKRIRFVSSPRAIILAGMDQPIMTTVGEALWQNAPKRSKLAAQWLEQWEKRYPDRPSWKVPSIESHFSRLKTKSEPQAVRFFFFEEPERTELLFEILNVPPDQHERIRALAEKALHTAPRLVIDISTWAGPNETLAALFDELERRVLHDCPLQPVALVLTDQQRAKSPQSFLDLRTLQQHKVVSAEDGRAKAIELAGDEAVVLAPWEFPAVDRWIAAEFKNNTLSFEPSDGLATFAERGILPGLPAIAHPLGEICRPENVRFRIDDVTPARRRWWMYTLADEARTIEAFKTHDGLRTPARRLAYAQQLGLAATSTVRERLDHELDQLAARIREVHGLTVETLDSATHAERLERANLRPTAPAAWRHGDELHLLHADAPIEHPRLVVHRPNPAVPALTRLLHHVSDWSVYDHEADPSLARTVETLDPAGGERPAFLHARASLLWNDLCPEPTPRPRPEHWLDDLRAVLAGDPPPASLRLRLPETANARDYLAFEDDDRLSASLKSPSALLVRPRGRCTIIVGRGRTVLKIDGEPPIQQTLTIKRDSSDSVEVSEYRGYCTRIFADERNASYYSSISIPSLWLPVLSPQNLDTDLWLDCLERSCALTDWQWKHSPRCEKLLRGTGKREFNILKGTPSKAEPVTIDPMTWREADLRLAECWLALRAALVRPLCVHLPREVVCSLGGGVSALLAIAARGTGASGDTMAALDASITGRGAAIDLRFVSTHTAQSGSQATEVGLRVPSHLVLQTSTISVSVTFIASPLLQANSPSMLGSLVVVAADEASADDNYDDDDDA